MRSERRFFIKLLVTLMLVLGCTPLNVIPQSFDGNINVPTGNGKGSLNGDICYTGDFVFLYSIDSITAYSASSGSYNKAFPFAENSNMGVYNPIFYNESYWTCDKNLMAYNSSANRLYVVSPDIRIMHISTAGNSPTLLQEQYLPIDSIRNIFSTIHGVNILKFSAEQSKLYWMIEGRNQQKNFIGSFHKRVRYLAIFSVDSEGSLSLIHDEYMRASGDYLGANISDIEYNTDISVNGNEFFYLSKLSRLEVWRIENPTTNPTISLFRRVNIDTSSYSCNFYKFGKMLYINDTVNNIHKLIATPYRYLDQAITNPDIFVLDCNHGDDSTAVVWSTISSPSKRVLDAEYIQENQHLIISYAPDTANYIGSIAQGSDITVYEYDSVTSAFSNIPYQYVNTNANYPDYDPYDINATFDLEKINGTDLVLSKKDQIVQLSYQSNEYSPETRKYAENNFFMKSVNTNFAKAFVLNTASNGLDVIHTNDNNKSNTITAFPVYDICASSTFDKMYFFNKLNVYGSAGIYIYNPLSEELISINEDNYTQNDIEVPVGDCIFNPYQNHFLISENASFDDKAASIKVINNDTDNTFVASIELIDPQENKAYHAKKMFIAPNGNLYITANMRHDSLHYPQIFVFEAKESGSDLYSLLEVINVGNVPSPSYNGIFEFYTAHFCYNPFDHCVYMTIHPNEHIIDPYNSVPNTVFNSSNSYSGDNGLLIRMGENSSSTTALNYPGKIICPAAMGAYADSQYGNKMYIIGENFYEVQPLSLSEYSITYDTTEPFNDITYNPINDRIYCLRDDSMSSGTHRQIEIFCIDTSSNYYNFNNIYSVGGQATSLFNNPYDNKLYIHQMTDENKRGGTPVRLISLDHDPQIQSLVIDSINFQMSNIYPEVDHNGDHRFYLYNMTNPAINPYNNTMYIPNGGHSCVSKVSFTARESKLLENEGWTWLSFPRMNRNFNDAVWIPDVLDNNIDPGNYQDSSKLQNLKPGQDYKVESIYTLADGWNSAGELDSTKSTHGYKLYLKYNDPPGKNLLFYEGNLYDHFNSECNNCRLDLVGADKYWVGYYYPISQYIIDAIPDEIEPLISVIKGQYYTCYGSPQSDGSVQWNCAINKRAPNIHYGDMIEIIPVLGDSIMDFYWAINNNNPSGFEKAETEYYSYTETSDYTPVFIELDSSDNPVEIGAFVNDSCIGGSTVLPEDSLVLVPAYTEGMSGEIYFEEYYGSQKSIRSPITNYYVINQQSRHREKRMIHTSEGKDYYVVSFNDNTNNEKKRSHQDARISCQPNPLSSTGTVKCYIPQDGNVEIKLYNMLGSGQLLIFTGFLSAGNHEFIFSSTDINVNSLVNGTYILTLKSTEYQVQTKIIVIQ
ncbi:MAG: T9SS type A sorting domain-containing protein [Bacteroidales bacterium]|nr:T9SS type A sorting domain-containing protein [Bacteroidales bacterium]